MWAFDPEFNSGDPGEVARLRMKNVNNLLHFEVADAGIALHTLAGQHLPQAASPAHHGGARCALTRRPSRQPAGARLGSG